MLLEVLLRVNGIHARVDDQIRNAKQLGPPHLLLSHVQRLNVHRTTPHLLHPVWRGATVPPTPAFSRPPSSLFLVLDHELGFQDPRHLQVAIIPSFADDLLDLTAVGRNAHAHDHVHDGGRVIRHDRLKLDEKAQPERAQQAAKGKGIKFIGEYVRRKVGKTAAA